MVGIDAESTRPQPHTHPGRFLRVRWPLLGVVLASGTVALLARANLFPLMSGDADEPVYVYQARMLAQGHVTLAARVNSEFFYPWLFGQRGGRLFSQYQPGWPSVIALAHLLGNERVALVIAAVSAVVATWFLAQEVAPGSGVYASALLLLSPIFVVQSGLYLSYLWTAALVAGALAGLLAGMRTKRGAPFGASGALFGLALFTRPFDAFVVAVVAGGYLLFVLLRDLPGLRRALTWTVAGGLPFLGLTAVYNAQLTGSPLRFPLQAADSHDTFGFGARTMARDQPAINYTPHAALSALARNVLSMPHWFAGGGVGLLLAIAAVVMHRRRRETWLVVAMVAVFPVAYVFWWATALAAPGASRGLGPHYYIPAFLGLAVLAGCALQDLARRSRSLTVVGIAVVFAGSCFMAPTILHNAHLTTSLQRAKAAPLKEADLKNAVVVMRANPSRYAFADDPFLVGNPGVDNHVLYANDRGPSVVELTRLFPTRTLYQYVQRTQPGHSLLQPSYLLEPMQVPSGSTVTLRFGATNTDNRPFVVAYIKIGGRTVAMQTLDRASHFAVTEHFDVVLGAPGTRLPPPRPGTLVARVGSPGQVQVDVAFGLQELPYGADIFERRYFVTPSEGNVEVQKPGLQYHLYVFGKAVWARENVGLHLAELP